LVGINILWTQFSQSDGKPNYFTNIVETISIFLIPIAMVFAMGYVLKRRKLA
jgi:K+-transporting ATPase A subunit